jgi:hypothetical protein
MMMPDDSQTGRRRIHHGLSFPKADSSVYCVPTFMPWKMERQNGVLV